MKFLFKILGNKLWFLYLLPIAAVIFLIYFEISARIEHSRYSYNSIKYNHQIDFLFHEQYLDRIKFKETYKSGDMNSLYFLCYDSLSYLVIIESVNYKNITLNTSEIIGVNRIGVSQARTYSTFIIESFPIVEQILNPKESSSLKILLESPYYIDTSLKGQDFVYLSGNFSLAAIKGRQTSSIVSFINKNNKELVVLNCHNKTYFLIQIFPKDSFRQLLNPQLLN